MRIAEQQTELVRAELHSLKVQLQPHFLFNTLHSIGSLMHYDVARAERMLARLSDLLRRSLQDGATPTVSLRQEAACAQAYLEIERLRFPERLQVSCQLPEELLEQPVPSFILQPLIENAVKYGIAPRAEGGTVTLRAYAEGGCAVLEVIDDAPDTLAAQAGFGIGLRNTRERLATLYGDAVHFELVRESARTVARIRLLLAVGITAIPALHYA